jgi:hypothetical protein
MQGIRSKLSYANVVSTLCLFLVLGTGVAFGAKKLIDGAKIKPHSITAKQIKNNSLTPAVFKGGLPAGPAGAVGPVGPAGAPGSALAYARVAVSSNLPFISSAGNGTKNVTLNLAASSAGVACLTVGGSAPPVNVVATEDPVLGVEATDTVIATVDSSYVHAECGTESNALIETFRGGANKSLPVYVLFN